MPAILCDLRVLNIFVEFERNVDARLPQRKYFHVNFIKGGFPARGFAMVRCNKLKIMDVLIEKSGQNYEGQYAQYGEN